MEERDHPELVGQPVIIGSDPRQSGGRGVVSTCNYEARKYGVHSAMSTKEALDRCPQAVFISGDYAKYRAVGQELRAIFKRFTDLVEPMSIDEAYLDVTVNKLGISSAMKVAKLIQLTIWEELRLTCSAGVSYNKFLAKLASDFEKPRGLTVILPDQAEGFLADLPIDKFHGVGQKSVARLQELGVYRGKDLQALSEAYLIDHFGRFGYDLYRKARGISNSPVKPDRMRKSIGSERTYGKLLRQETDVKAELQQHTQRVVDSLQRQGKVARVLVIKVRYGDFKTLTKRQGLEQASDRLDHFVALANDLYDKLEEANQGIRLLGVTLTGLEEKREDITLPLS